MSFVEKKEKIYRFIRKYNLRYQDIAKYVPYSKSHISKLFTSDEKSLNQRSYAMVVDGLKKLAADLNKDLLDI